jgi:parvulin-like peptidyl-prolyl isomerase
MARRNQIRAEQKKKLLILKWLLPLIPIIIIGGIFTWLYQSKDIVMRVGSESIHQAELDLEIKRLKPPDYDQRIKSMDAEDRQSAEETLNAKALENLMKLKSIYLYAKENHLKVSKQDVQDEVDKFIRDLKTSTGSENVDFKSVLADYRIPYRSFLADMKQQAIYNKVLKPVREEVTATDDELIEFYTQYKEYYDSPDQAKLLMMSVEKEEEADEILAALLNGEEFGKLAKDKSLAPDVDINSGDIGWVTPDELYKEIADNVFHEEITLKQPYKVQGRDGFYIFIVQDRKEAETKTYDEVKKLVEEDFLRNKQDRAVDSFMYRLTEKYEMNIKKGNPWTDFMKWLDSLRGRV